MARLYDEVRGVLEQRSKPETQFEIYKNTKQDKINEFVDRFMCSEEEVLPRSMAAATCRCKRSASTTQRRLATTTS